MQDMDSPEEEHAFVLELSRSAEFLEVLPPTSENEGMLAHLFSDISKKQEKLASLIRNASENVGEDLENFTQDKINLLLKLHDKVSSAIIFHKKWETRKDYVQDNYQALLAMLREDGRAEKIRAVVELGRLALEPSKCKNILSGGGLAPIVYSFIEGIDSNGPETLQIETAKTVTNLAFIAQPTLPLYSNTFGPEAEAVLQAIKYFRNNTLDKVDYQCVIAQALANLSYCAARGDLAEHFSVNKFKQEVTPLIVDLIQLSLYEGDYIDVKQNNGKSNTLFEDEYSNQHLLMVDGNSINNNRNNDNSNCVIDLGNNINDNVPNLSRFTSSSSSLDNQTYLKVETRCWSFVALAYILFDNSWDGLSDNLDGIVDVIKLGLMDEDEEVIKHAANCTANLCSARSISTPGRSKDQYLRGYIEARIASGGIIENLCRLALSGDGSTRRYVASALSSLAGSVHMRKTIVRFDGLQALATLASLSVPSDVVWDNNNNDKGNTLNNETRTKSLASSITPTSLFRSLSAPINNQPTLSNNLNNPPLKKHDSSPGAGDVPSQVVLPPTDMRALQETSNSPATQLFVAISLKLLAQDDKISKKITSTSAVHSLLVLIHVSAPNVRYNAMEALGFLSENDETYDILIDHLDRLLQSAETDFNVRDCLARILANLINSSNSANEKHRKRIKGSKKILSVIMILGKDNSGSKDLQTHAMRALAGYLEILMDEIEEKKNEGRRGDDGDVLSRDVFLNVLDIVEESLQSDHGNLRYEGYKALSKLARVPKHHARIVSKVGRYLISSNLKSSESNETMKYINQTLFELGFDPSSDIKLCQYDSSLFEHWFMIKKRLKVQDQVEKSINLLLENLWKEEDAGMEVLEESIQDNFTPENENMKVDGDSTQNKHSAINNGNSDNFETKNNTLNNDTPLLSSTPKNSNKISASTNTITPPLIEESPSASMRADSLMDIVFGFNIQDLRKRSRSSTVPNAKNWTEYIKSNPAHDGSTLIPGLDPKSLIEFVGYYPSLLQRRLLLFSPDRGPLDELPQIRTLVMPNHEYYTFKYGAILEKTVERNYDLADVWSILFTSCQFENDSFVKNFCEALYRLPTVYFLTFYNGPNKRKLRGGSHLVSLISNLPPFIGWITFDNALSPNDLKDIMIPLARSNVSGLAIRNSNFTLKDIEPFLDVLKHNSSLQKRLSNKDARSNKPQDPILAEMNVQIGKHVMAVNLAETSSKDDGNSNNSIKNMPSSPTDPIIRTRRSKGENPISPFSPKATLIDGDQIAITPLPKISLNELEGLQTGVLRWLDLSGNKLGDKGAAALIKLCCQNPCLVSLDLSKNNIGSGYEFCKELCGEKGLLEHTESCLETLILSDNALVPHATDVILKKLWVIACTQESSDDFGLLTLDLSMNPLNKPSHSQSLNELILANGTLRDLNLEACDLTKECLEKMNTSIAKNSRLHFLRLDGNDVQNKINLRNIFKKLKTNRIDWANSLIVSPYTEDDLNFKEKFEADGNEKAVKVKSSSSDDFSSANGSISTQAKTAMATMKMNDNTNESISKSSTNSVIPNNNGLKISIANVPVATASPVHSPKVSPEYQKQKFFDERIQQQIPVLGVLFSAPLVYQEKATLTMKPMPMLDFDLERMLVEQVIRRSNRKIELMFEYASTKTLRNMVTLGHRALHFSGHGFKDSLAFEDEHGGLHMVVVNQLRHLCAAGGRSNRGSNLKKQEDGVSLSSSTSNNSNNRSKGVQFVFVSACYSQSAGEAFVQAGIPHVVCVSVNSNLLDKAAQEFTHAFYLSLAVGGTVAASFEIGVEAVKSAPRLADPIKEGEKFLLLPRDGDHNVPIFANAPIRNVSIPGLTRTKSGHKLTRTSSGSFSDLGKLLPSVPDNFLGRNVDMYRVMGYTKERRIVTILGAEGCGKSALAIATANYIDERSESFIDGIYFIRLAGVTGAELETTICESIGYSTSKRKRLIQYMRKKSLLLVLDQVDTKLVSSKEFRSFIQILLDKTRANVLFTSKSRIGLTNDEQCYLLKPLSIEDEGRLFFLRSPYQRREWLSKRKVPNDMLGRSVHNVCKGNPGTIVQVAREIEEEIFQAMFQAEVNNRMNM